MPFQVSGFNVLCADVVADITKRAKLCAPKPPRGPLSAFMCYAMAMRGRVQQERPETSFTEVAREIGQRWGGLLEPAKVFYIQQATQDARRFQHGMQPLVVCWQ